MHGAPPYGTKLSPEFCFGHWQTQCRATYGAPVDPHVVLGGFPNGPEFRNFSADATTLVVTFPVDASSDNRCAAPPGQTWLHGQHFRVLSVRMVLRSSFAGNSSDAWSPQLAFSHAPHVAPVQREASGHCRHKLLKPWRTAHGSA